MSILIFIIVLSALVIVHEAGHFFAAKFFKIRVDEFGLGYPPRARHLFTWRGTEFTLNWLPFGGFVRIFGENPTDDSLNDPESLVSKSRWSQAAVLIAGVVANFVFAWVLFSIVLMLGINGETGTLVKYSFFPGLWHGLLTTGKLTGLLAQAIFGLLWSALHGTADLSGVVGPIGLVGFVGEATALGFSYLLYFTALISINLGIVNLLPFPALDGGRLLFVAIEGVRKKSIPVRVFNKVNTAGFVILVGLMILITFRDISHLI